MHDFQVSIFLCRVTEKKQLEYKLVVCILMHLTEENQQHLFYVEMVCRV